MRFVAGDDDVTGELQRVSLDNESHTLLYAIFAADVAQLILLVCWYLYGR